MIKIKGFTLIELLVVISIIGLLATLLFVSFTASQKQARDTERKSDLAQYRNSLEVYANKNNGIYIISATATPATGSLCDTLVSSEIISSSDNCPEDPKFNSSNPGSYEQYKYQTDASGIDYALWAKLENGGNYWLVCSNGTTKTKSGSVSLTDCQ